MICPGLLVDADQMLLEVPDDCLLELLTKWLWWLRLSTFTRLQCTRYWGNFPLSSFRSARQDSFVASFQPPTRFVTYIFTTLHLHSLSQFVTYNFTTLHRHSLSPTFLPHFIYTVCHSLSPTILPHFTDTVCHLHFTTLLWFRDDCVKPAWPSGRSIYVRTIYVFGRW